jgi:ATP-dependent helicase/nuclease subunit B
MLDIPYVITVGLTAEEWPADIESTLPPEFQEAVLVGGEDVGTLAPRTAWTDGRDRDQFADILHVANRGLVVTRYTQAAEGEEVYPSPFLDFLNARTVSDTERQRLVATNRVIPTEIQRMLLDDS